MELEDIDGVPLYRNDHKDLEELSAFKETPLGEYFEVVLTEDASYQTGNEVADESPFGEDSIFFENRCGVFEEKFQEGKTDFAALAQDLKRNINHPNFIFDWRRYISTTYTTEKRTFSRRELDRFKPPPVYDKVLQHNPFEYEEDGEKKQAVFDRARLNKRICYLDPNWSYSITINPNKREAEFIFSVYYEGTEEFRKPAEDTLKAGDFRIDDKYRAIKLHTANASYFAGFLETVGIGVQSMIKDEFKTAFQKVRSNGDLDWLYEKAPDFVVESIDNQVLWNDLQKLLAYDKSKWLIDSSTAMIKVLKGIATKENGMQFLYNRFEANPITIKEMYYYLDKTGESSLHGGQAIPNKTIFASLLTAICNYKSQGYKEERLKTQVIFRATSAYRVDSNIKPSNDTYKDKYDLTQQQQIRIPEKRYDFYYVEPEHEEYIPFEPTQHLHPLDIVMFVVAGEDGQDLYLPLPAIFVKDRAHQREWAEIEQTLRVGLDLLAMVLGLVVTVTSGNPLFVALALADIGLAGTDIYVQIKKEEYMQTPEGRKFLRKWEQIYTIGGLAVAVVSAPQLIRSALNLGAHLYRSATGVTQTFLKNAMAKIIVEINVTNFTGNTVRSIDFGQEIFSYSGVHFNIGGLNRLESQRVTFLRFMGENEDLLGYGVLYRGEVIAQGTAKEVRDTLRAIWNNKGSKLKSLLDDIWKQIPRLDSSGKFWTATNKAGNEMRWRNQLAPGVNIFHEIEQAIAKGGSKGWEGEVLKAFAKHDEIMNFSNKVENLTFNKRAGDIDGAVRRYFIECKESVSKGVLNSGHLEDQLVKYIDESDKNFINFSNKKVVLAIKKLDEVSLSHPGFKKMLRRFNKNQEKLIIITDLGQIKKLY